MEGCKRGWSGFAGIWCGRGLGRVGDVGRTSSEAVRVGAGEVVERADDGSKMWVEGGERCWGREADVACVGAMGGGRWRQSAEVVLEGLLGGDRKVCGLWG